MKILIGNQKPVHVEAALEAHYASQSARAPAKKPAKPVKPTQRNTPELDTLDTLIPVQLDPDDLKEFLASFHPPQNVQLPSAYTEEAVYMADLVGYVSAVFTGLRYGAMMYQPNMKPDELGALITSNIEKNYGVIPDPTKRAKDFIASLSTGRQHIIRDSERFKGGKDLVYIGRKAPNVSPLLGPDTVLEASMPVTENSYAYGAKKELFDTNVIKAIVATAIEVQALFFGKQAVADSSSSYKRINKAHPIAAKMPFIDGITKIMISGPLAKLGVPVLLPPFKGEQTSHSLQRLPKYTSLLFVREPNNVLVLAKSKAKDQPDDAIQACKEALALQPDIRISFVVSIPQKFCEYITQTKGESIPLVPLNTWSLTWTAMLLRWKGQRREKGDKVNKAQGDAGRYSPANIPHYVFRPSISDELIARRKELGLYSEPGRVNEDGLVITHQGNLAFLPNADVSAIENAKAYEKISEEILALSFEAGTPLPDFRGSAGTVFELASPNYMAKINDLSDKLYSFKGTAQAINWDLNTVITVNNVSPDRVSTHKLIGYAKPTDLNFASLLRDSFTNSMYNMFSKSGTIENGTRAPVVKGSSFTDMVTTIRQSTVFHHFAVMYSKQAVNGKVPKFADLVKKAAEELKIANLSDDEAVSSFELQFTDPSKTIYGELITPDLKVVEPVEFVNKAGFAVLTVFAVASHHAGGSINTNLARVCIRDGLEISEHDRQFDAGRTLGDLGRLYLWLGGRVFQLAAKALLGLAHKELMTPVATTTEEEALGMVYPTFNQITHEVIPMCLMYSKYTTPEVRDAILKKADELKEAEEKFTVDDLNLAGSKGPDNEGKGGMKLFPHQESSLIRLKAHPKFAILDIAPGGGKTTIGIADIACLYADGLIKRPFVFAPNRLVRNWIEDCHKSFKGWNVIPVTTETYKMWGEQRLTEMIQKAPRNTIVVIGNSFMSHTQRTQIVIGNSVDKLANSIEFAKKFEPDYVIVDESHRVRNTTSSLHQAIKNVMLMSSIKYARLATGTLIQNVMSDVVGQTSMFNSQVFRTTEEFDREHKSFKREGGTGDYVEGTAVKARERLSDFVTVISFKRKEWAFMLPTPVESFFHVDMRYKPVLDKKGDPVMGPNGMVMEDDVMGAKLQAFYDGVLADTMRAAKDAIDKVKKKRDKEDADEEEAGSDAVSRTIVTANGTKIDSSTDDDDSDDLDEFDDLLQPYLQKLERLLTDPFGDPDPVIQDAAKSAFGEDYDTSYVTPKVRLVVNLIKKHFQVESWQKGKSYRGSDIAEYNGKTYIFKSDIRSGEGEEVSTKSPDSDPNWKLQILGKVFIACRYTRSVDAIFRALPKDLQAKTVRFHGEIDNKDDNLARFQKDDKCQILIANEMGVSEGHNFQMATRFIRVEAPWAPGELDQTSARIFRPSVGDEYIRQTIFLDWVLCDGTLEVAKMGRLVSKMLKRAKFDEADNPKYYKDLVEDLPVISMSLENIQALNRLSDLCAIDGGEGDTSNPHPHSYIGQYAYLVQEMGDEFREMRLTRRSTMVDVKPTPMPKDAGKIEFVPWVPNLKVEDTEDEGLVPLREAMESEDNPLAIAFRKDRTALIGQYVRTEFGLGVISRVTTGRGKKSGEDDEDGGNEISKVGVTLAQGGQVEMLSASKVYLATKITEKTKNKYNAKAPNITEDDKKRTAKDKEKADKAIERIRTRSGRKIRVGDEEPVKKPRARTPKEEDVEDTEEGVVHLYPKVYNGFLCLKAQEEGVDRKVLHRHGFKPFGNYAYIIVANYLSFEAILDYLEEKYKLSPQTIRLLDSLHDSFQSGRGRKFAVELAPVAELPNFYRTNHILTKVTNPRKPELKLYPMIGTDGSLVLMVDLATNPSFRKSLNKTIPGAKGKFEEDDGMDICFFRSKSELGAKVKELRDVAGLEIANYEELKEEVRGMTFRKRED